MKYLLLAAMIGLSTAASAAELAPTEDGARVLANKNVNGERWAITYDIDRHSVTGNVLLSNGGAAFIDCDARTAGPNLELSCKSFAGGTWGDAGDVTLPGSFFGLNGGGSCSETDYPTYLYISYGDSCGLRANADLDFDVKDGCSARGDTYDASDPAIEGLTVAVVLNLQQRTFIAQFTYHGACQGQASGGGAIGEDSFGGWQAEGSVAGSTSCCGNLNATFAIHQ